MIWVVIAALAVGTIVVKTIGPLLAGGTEPPAPVNRVIEFLTPALLASLIVTSTIGDGQHLVIDSRAAGVLVGAVLLLLRLPLVVALTAGAATAATVHAFL